MIDRSEGEVVGQVTQGGCGYRLYNARTLAEAAI